MNTYSKHTVSNLKTAKNDDEPAKTINTNSKHVCKGQTNNNDLLADYKPFEI
jgi:hypothetical protein